MSKFPKTIAAVQRRDRSQWEIGDALLAETDVGDSYDELQEVADEIEHLKIEGYSVGHLANLRRIANNFSPTRVRALACWDACYRAGTPEMLEAIVRSAGSKPVTSRYVATMRPVIEEHQARKHKESGERRQVPPTKDIPSQKEVRGLALVAEVAQWVNNLKRCDVVIDEVCDEVEKKLSRLEAVDIDYLADIFLSIAEKARRGAEIARRLRSNRRAHLSVVGE